MSTRTNLQHVYRFWSSNLLNWRSYSDFKMCGHKVRLPGLWYTRKIITANIELLNDLKRLKQLNSFFNNLWVALKRAV